MSAPTRRAALAVCAALLLVTAGCSGWTGPSSTGNTTDATTTATDDATTPPTPDVPASTTGRDAGTGTWSPTVSVDQYPPGVAENGTLANTSALLDAHFAATANMSVVFTAQGSGQNRTLARTYGHGADGTPYYSSREETDEDGRVLKESYWVGTRGYARTYTSARPELGTTYRVLQNVTHLVGTSVPGDQSWQRFNLHSLLQQGTYTVNGTVERDGRTFVELTATEGANDLNRVTEYDGRMLVTPDGVVYDVTASLTRLDGEGAEKHYESNATLATGVEWTGAPSWVDGLPQLQVSIVKDGHAVEVRNTGGASLPANTSLDVFARDDPLSWAVQPGQPSDVKVLRNDEQAVTVTTGERLEPGEAVYVTAGADGSASSFTLHDEPARGEYEFGFAGLRSDGDDIWYRLATGIVPYDAD